MCGLKVGDRVRRINRHWSGMKVGDEGIVTGVSALSVISLKEYGGEYHAWNFTLIPEAPFKVNDEVEVVSGDYLYTKPGSYGKVVGFDLVLVGVEVHFECLMVPESPLCKRYLIPIGDLKLKENNVSLTGLEGKYKELGEEISKLKDLDKKSKEIDFSKVPEGTIVDVLGFGKRHFSKITVDRKYGFYRDGKNPLLCSEDPFLVSGNDIRLIDNPPQPWFGGGCPLPDNVKIKIWYRSGETCTVVLPSLNAQSWGHSLNPRDIIAYQVLESDWQG